MARTPIFDDIRRAFRIAAYLERRGSSTSEGLERLEEIAWSRRRFLRTAVTATAGAAMTPLLSQCNCACEPPKVVIVGAGVAGLVCAYRLQQNGIPSRVIEASTRVGGRMFSLRNYFPDNQVAELGGELIDSEHTHLRNLAKELALNVTDLAYDDGPNGHVYFFDREQIKIDAAFIEMFREVLSKITIDLDQMKVRGEIDYETPHAGKMDNLSIEEWFAKRGVTGKIADILKVAYRGENGLEIGEQSALNLLTMMGEQPDGDEIVHLFGKSDERYHIAEGNDSVPTRLAQKLDCEVELGTSLEAISQKGRSYSLSIKRDVTAVDINADIVVLALPFTTLRTVNTRNVELPEDKRRAINELGYGTNAKLMAGLSRRIWGQMMVDDSRTDARYTAYTFSDLDFQCCWETSRGQPGTHAILTNFVGGKWGADFNQRPMADRAVAFMDDVEKIYQGSRAAFTNQAVRQHWPSSPFVLGSYTCFRPGQVCAFDKIRSAAVGQIYFAGEHTSEASGFMEGGVESGERVAREILKKIGHRRARQKAA